MDVASLFRHHASTNTRAVSRATLAGLAITGLTLSLASCATPPNPTPPGVRTVYGREPQHPLITTNTNETGGGDILQYLYRGLASYRNDGSLQLANAAAITPNHNSTRFEVRLHPNWTFSNGEPVTAKSYVDAWNYGACGKNLQLGQSFFSTIDGYDAIANPDTPTNTCTLRGLRITSTYSFTITLNQPESGFPLRLGHITYMPLPQVAYNNMEAFGQHPIGNGPYKLIDGKAWLHNDVVKTEVNPTYAGTDKPRNKGLWFTFYTNPDTAYADLLGGQLDTVGSGVGPTALATFQTDFPHSNSNKPTASSQSFIIPSRLPHFSGEEGRLRRAAISLAINRPLITQKIFFSTRTPAKDFSSPTMADASPTIPGNSILTYQPNKAKQLWAQANKISPWSGSFHIAYNADGGHQQWVDAVCNNIHTTLGITANGKAYPTFKQLRDEITQRSITTAFRSGWLADYPSVYNFLEPQFMTGASANDGDYSNPTFDELLSQAAAAPTIEAARALYVKAQTILMRDLPAIPLWYPNASTAWNPQLHGVHIMWNGYPNYTEIYKPTVTQ